MSHEPRLDQESGRTIAAILDRTVDSINVSHAEWHLSLGLLGLMGIKMSFLPEQIVMRNETSYDVSSVLYKIVDAVLRDKVDRSALHWYLAGIADMDARPPRNWADWFPICYVGYTVANGDVRPRTLWPESV